MATLGLAPRFCSSDLNSFVESQLIYRLKIALTFLNDPCSSAHGSVTPTAIFISQSGEWKLGGFELLSNPKEEAAVLYVSKMLPSSPICPHHASQAELRSVTSRVHEFCTARSEESWLECPQAVGQVRSIMISLKTLAR